MVKSPTSITANIFEDPEARKSLDNSFSWAANDAPVGSPASSPTSSPAQSYPHSPGANARKVSSLVQRWNTDNKPGNNGGKKNGAAVDRFRRSKDATPKSPAKKWQKVETGKPVAAKKTSHVYGAASPKPYVGDSAAAPIVSPSANKSFAKAQSALVPPPFTPTSKAKSSRRSSLSSATTAGSKSSKAKSKSSHDSSALKSHHKNAQSRKSKQNDDVLKQPQHRRKSQTKAVATTIMASPARSPKDKALARAQRKREKEELKEEQLRQARMLKMRLRIKEIKDRINTLQDERSQRPKQEKKRMKQEKLLERNQTKKQLYRQHIIRTYYPELNPSAKATKDREKLVHESTQLIAYLRKDNETLRTQVQVQYRKQIQEMTDSNRALEATQANMKKSYEQLQQHVAGLEKLQGRLKNKCDMLRDQFLKHKRELQNRDRFLRLEERSALRYQSAIVKVSRRIEHRAQQSMQKRLSNSRIQVPPSPNTPPSPFTAKSRKHREHSRRAQQLVSWLASTIAEGENEANQMTDLAMRRNDIPQNKRLRSKTLITDALRDGSTFPSPATSMQSRYYVDQFADSSLSSNSDSDYDSDSDSDSDADD